MVVLCNGNSQFFAGHIFSLFDNIKKIKDMGLKKIEKKLSARILIFTKLETCQLSQNDIMSITKPSAGIPRS